MSINLLIHAHFSTRTNDVSRRLVFHFKIGGGVVDLLEKENRFP